MGNFTIGSDSPFVAAIQASLQSEAPHGARTPETVPVADAEQLAALCTLCFWVSLETEERREVRGTLVLCSPRQASLARAFKVPVPVTVSHLAALLTASPSTPLAVQGGPGGLTAWGVLDYEPQGLPHLRIAGNGTLLASRNGRVLALLHRGEVSIPAAADADSLEHLFVRTLGEKHSRRTHGNVPAKLIRVGATMIRHGHGGALVLVDPRDSSWQASVNFRYSFDEASANLLKGSIEDLETCLGESKKSYDEFVTSRKRRSTVSTLLEQQETANFLRNLTETLMRRVGDLCLIDGAVVMDLDLRLLGFGAKLLFGPEDFTVATLNAVTGELRESVPLGELGGTRHQSAARFVFANHRTDVFVVSQDGRLSMFSWSERLRSVAVVQNLEHFIWEHRHAS